MIFMAKGGLENNWVKLFSSHYFALCFLAAARVFAVGFALGVAN